MIDIVPNHVSDRHPWFVEALDGGPDSPLRERFWFRPGKGADGSEPPNGWRSHFGDSAWTRTKNPDGSPGDWYLHLFAPAQPDLNWEHPAVADEFRTILRFWLDLGVDGFRIDVAHGLVKDKTLADEPEPFPASRFASDWRTSIDQPEVHDVYRDWRRLTDSYDGDRVLIGEVVFSDQGRIAPYLRPDELHLAFNFSLVFQPWEAEALRRSIDESIATLPIVSWVLENHDVTRIVTRFGEREARAAALLLLALPGPAFLYQGQELGLEEVDLDDAERQDPIFVRSAGARRGRDGCRVPLPWEPGLTPGAWLPQPAAWAERSVAAQLGEPASMLSLYRRALELRPGGPFAWRAGPPGTLVFARGDTVCAVNVGGEPMPLTEGELLLASEAVDEALPAGAAAWLSAGRSRTGSGSRSDR
jgi:alpha-glucosidase